MQDCQTGIYRYVTVLATYELAKYPTCMEISLLAVAVVLLALLGLSALGRRAQQRVADGPVDPGRRTFLRATAAGAAVAVGAVAGLLPAGAAQDAVRALTTRVATYGHGTGFLKLAKPLLIPARQSFRWVMHFDNVSHHGNVTETTHVTVDEQGAHVTGKSWLLDNVDTRDVL